MPLNEFDIREGPKYEIPNEFGVLDIFESGFPDLSNQMVELSLSIQVTKCYTQNFSTPNSFESDNSPILAGDIEPKYLKAKTKHPISNHI